MFSNDYPIDNRQSPSIITIVITLLLLIILASLTFLSEAAGQHPAVGIISMPDGNGDGMYSMATGFVVGLTEDRTKGSILTNWHVIRDSGRAGVGSVYFPVAQRTCKVTAGMYDKDYDLALLTVDNPPGDMIAFAAENPQIGEAVTIAGWGGGKGYLEQTGRMRQYLAPDPSLPYEILEVTGAQARDGDSGGPMLNSEGRLVGVLCIAAPGMTGGSGIRKVREFVGDRVVSRTATEVQQPCYTRYDRRSRQWVKLCPMGPAFPPGQGGPFQRPQLPPAVVTRPPVQSPVITNPPSSGPINPQPPGSSQPGIDPQTIEDIYVEIDNINKRLDNIVLKPGPPGEPGPMGKPGQDGKAGPPGQPGDVIEFNPLSEVDKVVIVANQTGSTWPRLEGDINAAKEVFLPLEVVPASEVPFKVTTLPQAVLYAEGKVVGVRRGSRQVSDLLQLLAREEFYLSRDAAGQAERTVERTVERIVEPSEEPLE